MRTLLLIITFFAASFNAFAQVQIALEDFDGTSTWSNNAVASLFTDPSSADQGLFIEPGNVFGTDNVLLGRDLQNETNEPDLNPVTIVFNPVDITGATFVTVEFDYSISANASDELSYVLSVDGIPAATASFGNNASGTFFFDVSAFSATATSVSLAVTMDVNGASDEVELDNVVVMGIPSVQLPVTLTAFNAKPTTSGAMLEWTTASEENNDYFSVEMSRDAATFNESAQVKGNGTTESLQTYTFEYSNLTAGTYYFRLRQVDYDGQFSFSDVASLIVTGERDFVMVSNVVLQSVELDVSTPRPVRVLNMAGAVVAEFASTAGRNNLDVSSLPQGMYILSDGINAKRFVK